MSFAFCFWFERNEKDLDFALFFFVCFIVMAVRSFGADSSNCVHDYANFSFSRALNNNHSTHTGDWMKVCISSNCTTKKNSPEMHLS